MARLVTILLASMAAAAHAAEPVIPPAAPGSPVSANWAVFVDGRPVPVYSTMVFHGGPAFFCSFDVDGPAHVSARPAWPVRDAAVRPLSRGITPTVDKQSIEFDIPGPCRLSVEPNHLINHPLFIFASPIEEAAPRPDDPKVRYFGPGFHKVDTHTRIESGQEVYIAGGAWVQAVLSDTEPPTGTDPRTGVSNYQALFHAADGKDVTIRGRGVIDMSHLPWGARCAVSVHQCSNVLIEGVTILDCPRWTLVLSQSDHVRVENVKLIGHRESNDGVDICNSTNVAVRDSFIRVGDDGIVVKTFPGGGEARDLVAEGCVVWNDKVRAIGIAAEAAKPIHDVLFKNIDIIHDLTTDFDMGWTMAVYTEDRGPITDIRFEDIRCEDTRAKFILVCVKQGPWSTTGTLGPIERVTFKNVQYLGTNTPESALLGNDAVNHVGAVRIENLTMGGHLVENAEAGRFRLNEHVRNVEFVAGTGK